MVHVLRGRTLHIPETGDTGHLFVVLTNKCQRGMVLLAPICTQRTKHDRTCLLGVGDHDFIKQPSYIMYAKMQLFIADELEKKIAIGFISTRNRFSDNVLALICEGVRQSGFSAPKFQNYYSAHHLL